MGLHIGRHGWPMKTILGFTWSKKAEITLEAISFWQNISISIFQFSPFLHTIKVCQWSLINFSKFANALTRKEKTLMQQSMRKKKLRKVGFCFITGCFISPLMRRLFNHLFVLEPHSQPNFYFLISGWRKKYQKEK